MPFFHATFDRHIPSILRHGVGGRVTERNFEGAAVGVYLADSVEAALVMLIDWYMTKGQEDPEGVPAPRDFHASMRMIVIDDGRIRPDLLTHDEAFPDQEEIRRYLGVIDVTGMPILTVDQVTPPEFLPGGARYEEVRQGTGEAAAIWGRMFEEPTSGT
jgi:hypothetical protein